MEAQIGIAVRVSVAVKKKKDIYLARCPFLNIVSQGSTEDKAIRQLTKELAFLFSVCVADGTLEALLDKRAAVKREHGPADDAVQFTHAYVDLPPQIPMELLKRFTDVAASAP